MLEDGVREELRRREVLEWEGCVRLCTRGDRQPSAFRMSRSWRGGSRESVRQVANTDIRKQPKEFSVERGIGHLDWAFVCGRRCGFDVCLFYLIR